MWLVSWQEAGPIVTAVVRCDPAVRGPDVAPHAVLQRRTEAVGGHRPRRVAPPRGRFSLAATSPSALRRPPTPGRLRLGPARAALPRRHRAPLELAPFGLRPDLDE